MSQTSGGEKITQQEKSDQSRFSPHREMTGERAEEMRREERAV